MCMWPMSYLPKVKTCCFCASLKVGTMIIGIISLIGSTLLLLVSLVQVLQSLGVIDKVEGLAPQTHEGNFKWVDLAFDFAIFLIALLMFISTILLLLGTCTGDMKKLRLWLMINVVLFVVSTVLSILRLLSEFFTKEGADNKIFHFLQKIVMLALNTAIYAYCIIVVNSHYQANS